MIYYRIAWKNHQSSIWRWKSTKLTSLQTVFHFLRLHHAIPQDHLRVFSSSSCEGLKELLEEENQGRQQISVTAEQFLRERGMHAGKMTGRASAQSGSGVRENQEKRAITATLPPLLNQSSAVSRNHPSRSCEALTTGEGKERGVDMLQMLAATSTVTLSGVLAGRERKDNGTAS